MPPPGDRDRRSIRAFWDGGSAFFTAPTTAATKTATYSEHNWCSGKREMVRAAADVGGEGGANAPALNRGVEPRKMSSTAVPGTYYGTGIFSENGTRTVPR